jgi:hypothetical protein
MDFLSSFKFGRGKNVFEATSLDYLAECATGMKGAASWVEPVFEIPAGHGWR